MTLVRNSFNGYGGRMYAPQQTNVLLGYTTNAPSPRPYYRYGYTGTYTADEQPIGANPSNPSTGPRVPELVYISGVQGTTRLNYLPSSQSCAPFQSHADCDQSPNSKGGTSYDWNYGWSSCCSGFCPSKRQCAKPDPMECNIGNDILDRNPLIKIEWDTSAPNYRCTYDLHKINTQEQINMFVSKNGKSKTYDEIMTSFCEIPSHVCPVDPGDGSSDIGKGKPMDKCSRLVSLDDEGTRCRAWASTQDNKTVDNIKKEYCLHNPNSPDCRCINRSTNVLYDATKKNNPIPDGCWYKPCSTSVYLKTSDIVADGQFCPKEMCQIIYDANKNNNVVIKDNTNNIKCDFSKFSAPGPPPTPGPIPIIPIQPIPKIPEIPNSGIQGLFQNKTVIAGIAVGAVLIILLFMMKGDSPSS
jgi:hypothetical protein